MTIAIAAHFLTSSAALATDTVMTKELTPELIRRSTIAHLDLAAASGVRHTLKTRRSTPSKKTSERAPTVRKETAPAIMPKPARTTRYEIPNIPTDVQAFDALQSFIGDCVRCKLCAGRTNIVFGVGNPKAEIMFVGEGPGADEDAQGIPFVGRAGQLLTKMIEAMGFSRDDIYIANIVKCRPPENRAPEPDEMAACKPFLLRQIQIVAPKAIVCLGATATQALLETQIPISKLRGRFQELGGVKVMPTFHPAFLLRSPQMKKFTWEDLQQVMALVGRPVPQPR